jgi:integrase
MPPVLWDVLAALPNDLSGVRDRALLLVGFVGAFRRSELAVLERPHVADHPRGLVITIPRSKTDPYGQGQLIVLPHSSRPERCPVLSLQAWLEAAGIAEQWEEFEEEDDVANLHVFRPVHRNGATVAQRGMSEAAINNAVQRACVRALGSTVGPTRRTRCGPASPPTPPSGAPPTGPSSTRPGTAPWRRSTSTSASRAPGPTTPLLRSIFEPLLDTVALKSR